MPSYSTPRPSARSRITSADSSSIAIEVGGFPSTRRALSPRPIPRSIRPPESSWRVASPLAVTVGSRVAGFVTHVPRRMCSVAVAMSVRRTYASRQSTWLSKIHP